MKGVEEAVAIARLLDRPLVLAGKVDTYAMPYFKEVVEPLVDANRGLVEFLGEVSQLEASRLMASAHAFLMTTKYHESFGLVVVEALAVGTPVVATATGAMAELIRHGSTGFVVPMRGSDIDIQRFAAGVQACKNLRTESCRQSASRFRPEHMAKGYESVYADVAQPERVRRSRTR
jgi:glycosyltransferase involved in cell wall biosynthesis